MTDFAFSRTSTSWVTPGSSYSFLSDLCCSLPEIMFVDDLFCVYWNVKHCSVVVNMLTGIV